MIAALRDAEGVITGADRFTARVLDSLPRLKAIGRMGVGYDTVDVRAPARNGVAVCTARGANHEAVAEFAFALMLATARRLLQADRTVGEGTWSRVGSVQVSGKTLGIVGLGLIGKESARRARAFGMRVLAYDVYPDHEFAAQQGVTFTSLDDLLRQSDFVTLHVDLNERTRGLIGEAQLRAMKPSAYLINTSRGPVVDERALTRALTERWIRGAGLDVFEREPLTESNLVLSPHEAGSTEVAWAAYCRMSAESVSRVINARKLLYAVNPEVVAGLPGA